MRELAVLGQCAPGVAAVQTSDGSMFGDNPLYNTQPFVSASDPAYHGPLAGLPLQAVLVRVNSPATLERVRTYLAVNAPPQVSAGQGQSPTPPRTFGETLQIRTQRADTLENLRLRGGRAHADRGRVQPRGRGRRRAGRPQAPVHPAPGGRHRGRRAVGGGAPRGGGAAGRGHVLAAAIAYWTSVLAFVRLAPAGTAIPQLGHAYYDLMGAGLRHRLRGHRGDAAAAAADDRARQRPLRVSVRAGVSAGTGG